MSPMLLSALILSCSIGPAVSISKPRPKKNRESIEPFRPPIDLPFGPTLQTLLDKLIMSQFDHQTHVGTAKCGTPCHAVYDVFPTLAENIQADKEWAKPLWQFHFYMNMSKYNCNKGKGHKEMHCEFPIDYRRMAMQRYFEPYLSEGCTTRSKDFKGLTVQMRRDFDEVTKKKGQAPTRYMRVPPCSMISDAAKTGGPDGAPFEEVRLLVQEGAKNYSACVAHLKEELGDKVKVVDVTPNSKEEVCEIISSPNVLIGQDSTALSLLLLSPEKERVFTMMPCDSCDQAGLHNEDFLRFAEHDRYQAQMCKMLNGTSTVLTGYEVKSAYDKPEDDSGDAPKRATVCV